LGSLLRADPVEHRQCRIHASPGRLPLVADNPDLGIPAAQEEARAMAGAVILRAHRAASASVPVIAPTAALVPVTSPVLIIAISRRTLGRCRCGKECKRSRKKERCPHMSVPYPVYCFQGVAMRTVHSLAESGSTRSRHLESTGPSPLGSSTRAPAPAAWEADRGLHEATQAPDRCGQ
jgi:hypothetical protein